MKQARTPGVRDGIESSLTSESGRGEAPPEEGQSPRPPVGPRARNRRRGKVVVGGSVFVIGCALIAGYEYVNHQTAEVSELRADLKATNEAKDTLDNTWRQATVAGFDHTIGVTPSPNGEVKLTLSTDPTHPKNPNACKITMDVGFSPNISLLTYDASGVQSEATVVNRIVDHAGQMALLEQIGRSHEESKTPC